MTRITDPSAIDGKFPLPAETIDVLVIGAGPAGIAAAMEAARRGRAVVLIDENPVDPGLMGLDVPLYFGARMTAAVRNPGRILEQIVESNPDIESAINLGVDLRLGVTAWGLFVNGPSLRSLPTSLVGLADSDRSWMCGFKKLILATGARDIAFAFTGWDQPGVTGARALECLVERYGAFSGERIAIVGSGELAARTALMAIGRGLQVAALIEVREAAECGSETLAELNSAGIQILTGHVPRAAIGGAEGVKHLVLSNAHGAEVGLDCDTVCMALGLAPAIELLSAAGAALVPDSHRGGHVPILAGWETSLKDVYVAGNCAASFTSTASAADQGVQAARQALGEAYVSPQFPRADAWAYQSAWFEALTRHADLSLRVCQCEEVTRGDILAVRPPKYVGGPIQRSSLRDLTSLIKDGPVDQDQIKRLTRACMGVCQARRCREQVAFTLAQAAGVEPAQVPLAGYRAPVRPIPLAVLADWQENPAMSAEWEPWFRIRGQWAAYEDIGTDREFTTVFGGG